MYRPAFISEPNGSKANCEVVDRGARQDGIYRSSLSITATAIYSVYC